MATRYWVGGTGTWSTSSTSNWSASSGGASGASAPTSADDVIFDNNSSATSPYSVTIDSGGVVCNTLNCSGTTRTVSFTTISSNTISIAGSGTTVLQIAANNTTNQIITYQLTYSGGTGTRTIAAFSGSALSGFAALSVNSSSDVINITGNGANPCRLAALNFASGCTNTLTYGNNVTFRATNNNQNLLTLQSGMTLNTSTYSTTFYTQYDVALYTKGKSFGSGGVTITTQGSVTFNIQEALTTTGAFTYTTASSTGTYPTIRLYADLTCATFNFTGPTSAYTTLQFYNNSSIVLTSSGTITLTRASFLRVAGSSYSIKLTSNTGAHTISGTGTDNIPDIYVQGTTNTSSVTFGSLSTTTVYSSIINQRTVGWSAIFTSGIFYNLYGDLSLNGYNSSNRVSIQSSSAGSQFYFVVSGNRSINPYGYISLDNVNIKDSNVFSSGSLLSPGYAGTNSTDNGNNTNWVFGYYVVSPLGTTGTSALGAESVTTGTGIIVSVTGVQATTSVGNVIIPNENVFPVGVVGTTLLGTAYYASAQALPTGVIGTAVLGSVDVPYVVNVTGTQATGQIGTVDVPFVADVFGVQGTVYLANVTVGVAVYPTGFQANMTMGKVAVWIGVDSAQTTTWTPINTLQY